MTDPWHKFERLHRPGELLEAPIYSVADFGIFVALPNGVVGLVRVEDIESDGAPETALKRFNKGDRIIVEILSIDVEKQRIRLRLVDPGGDAIAEVERPSGPMGPTLIADVLVQKA